MFGTLLKKATNARPVWKNWAETVQCHPTDILYPTNEQEVAKAIQMARKSGKSIRVVGSGHSFSKLLDTNHFIVCLDRMQGLIALDEERAQATVWAGTKLKALGEILLARGYAQENLGDIDVQSVAGATGTGTHGTGVGFGVISTQIVNFTIVTANGETVFCSATENVDLFNAGRVSLGALGIITKITLQLVPTYKLEYESRKSTVDEVIQNIDAYNNNNRNFEYYWFPYTETVQLKISNATEVAPKETPIRTYIKDVLIENNVFQLFCSIGKWFPKSFKLISWLSATGVSVGKKINHSNRVYATPRNVRFKEMEYCVPAEHFEVVMRRIKETIEKNNYRVYMPIECRFSKGDDIWLSPAHGRATAYFAVHVYYETPHIPYFTDLEKIFMEYDGRPHWGKMHTRTAETLAAAYPKWNDFLEMRAKMDPEGVFLNKYLEELFGVRSSMKFGRESAEVRATS